MSAPTRPTKITFAEMRTAGVRGVLVYCSDYKCSHATAIAQTSGLIMSGSPIWKHGSYAKPAAREAPTSGRTLTGTRILVILSMTVSALSFFLGRVLMGR